MSVFIVNIRETFLALEAKKFMLLFFKLLIQLSMAIVYMLSHGISIARNVIAVIEGTSFLFIWIHQILKLKL